MSDPLVIPAGYAEAVCQVFLNGRAKPFSFSFGVQLHTTEQDAASVIAGWLESTASGGYAHALSSAYTTGSVNVTGHTNFYSQPTSQVGSDPAAHEPPGLAVKIKKVTNVRGKANKGYMFWPGIIEDGQVDSQGNLSSSMIVSAETIASGLITALTGDSLVPVVLHRTSSSVTTPTPINSFVIQPLVRSQRRRQIPR